MWCSFLTGCILGAFVENAYGQQSFLIPAAFTLVTGTCYMLFRQMLKDYVKGIEKARLSSDFEEVQAAMSHAQEKLRDFRGTVTRSLSSVEEDDLVATLDDGLEHMMETLHDVEADMHNLFTSDSRAHEPKQETVGV